MVKVRMDVDVMSCSSFWHNRRQVTNQRHKWVATGPGKVFGRGGGHGIERWTLNWVVVGRCSEEVLAGSLCGILACC